MLLADAGADVHPAGAGRPGRPRRRRARTGTCSTAAGRSVGVDLKHPDGVALVLDLVERADALVEGFRPGVAERLGLGPEDCWARNPQLVYGRMTGWGQDGPLAQTAGHDIDYIAIAGRPVADRPGRRAPGAAAQPGRRLRRRAGCCWPSAWWPPWWRRGRSGQGQVVDAAMVDGAASLMTMIFAFRQLGMWKDERGVNILDTGAHFYEVYETRRREVLRRRGHRAPVLRRAAASGSGLDAEDLPDQMDREQWPAMKERFAAVFATKTRDEWAAIFDGTDACAAPVLSPWEAHRHPHNAARGTFVEVDGVVQPGTGPPLQPHPGGGAHGRPRHPGPTPTRPWRPGGVDRGRVAALREAGALG